MLGGVCTEKFLQKIFLQEIFDVFTLSYACGEVKKHSISNYTLIYAHI